MYLHSNYEDSNLAFEGILENEPTMLINSSKLKPKKLSKANKMNKKRSSIDVILKQPEYFKEES